MSANLTTPKIKASFDYNFAKAITGLGANLTTGLVQSAFTLSPSTTTVANSGLAKVITLAAAGTSTIDLKTDLDPLGDAITATKVMGILIKCDVTSVSGGVLTVAPGASNGLTWFWTGTSPVITVQTGGMVAYAEPAGTTVDATHKTILLTNTGTQSISVTVVIFCLQ